MALPDARDAEVLWWIDVCEQSLRLGDNEHDVFGLYGRADALARVGAALADPFRAAGVTKVVGVEARGFLLGPLCAIDLGVPFVPARKGGRLLTGPTVSVTSRPDWEGKRVELRIPRSAVGRGDRILLVDDWLTTGNQARAVKDAVMTCNGTFSGVTAVVEDGADGFEDGLGMVHALVHWNERRCRFERSRLAR